MTMVWALNILYTVWESSWTWKNLSTHIDNDHSWCSVLNTAPLKIDVLYLMGTLQHTIHTDTYEHNLSSRCQAHLLKRDITTGHNARMLHIFTLRALLQLRSRSRQVWQRQGMEGASEYSHMPHGDVFTSHRCHKDSYREKNKHRKVTFVLFENLILNVCPEDIRTQMSSCQFPCCPEAYWWRLMVVGGAYMVHGGITADRWCIARGYQHVVQYQNTPVHHAVLHARNKPGNAICMCPSVQ